MEIGRLSTDVMLQDRDIVEIGLSGQENQGKVL
jgi:hypothetical protein